MKVLIKILIGISVLIALNYFIAIPYIHNEAKKFSLEKKAVLDFEGSRLELDYLIPSTKGRIIFDKLVPFGKIWLKGANEPTTFTTTQKIKIIDKTLPVGKYSSWTIPNNNSWKVIFNTDIPEWGVTHVDGNQSTHKTKYDYLTIEVPTEKLEEPIEDLSINFEDIEVNNTPQNNLSLAWDSTKIMVSIYK